MAECVTSVSQSYRSHVLADWPNVWADHVAAIHHTTFMSVGVSVGIWFRDMWLFTTEAATNIWLARNKAQGFDLGQ